MNSALMKTDQSLIAGDLPPYLEGLNPPQRDAILQTEGPLLVLAGAGTGKTRVLTTRIAHILLTNRAKPHQILSVTFTNKAAREMGARLEKMIGQSSAGLWLGTFHALAARILRRHAELVGLKNNFIILDADDQVRLLKQLIASENIEDDRYSPKVLSAVIQRWKDRGLTPDKISTAEAGDLAGGRMVSLYRAYQDRLKMLNAADFGDLLLHNLTIFRDHPAVLQNYQGLFRYILVDEYQDTNVSQYLWLRLLAQQHQNICCVGDDDQSIYSWRGAEVGNILRFDKDFADAKTIRLEQNYRSTAHILGAAAGLIAKNNTRLGKTLWTEQDSGSLVKLRALWDGEDEARFVGDEIEAAGRKGISLSEMAVLVRAGFQTREFEERLLTLGIPYRVIGGLRFYERAEIRDAIAYLRLLVTPEDDLAFERIVNVPKRGVGDTSIKTLHEMARAQNTSLFEAAQRIVETDEIRGPAKRGLTAFTADMLRWRSKITELPQSELMQLVLEESGYTQMLMMDKSPEAPGRLDNLKELVNAMDDFENLLGFLEHVSLVMDNAENNSGPMVSLMTLHAAKGLEFDYVFLPGWEEGLFPHQRALDESGNAGLEEERRLAYVGITRGKQEVFISYASSRRVHNQWQSNIPSRFVSELPEEHIDFMNQQQMHPKPMAYQYHKTYDEYNNTRGISRRPALELIANRSASAQESESGFKVGQRVFHQKFGYGIIVAVDHNKLDVRFEKSGTKKVVDSFVSKA